MSSTNNPTEVGGPAVEQERRSAVEKVLRLGFVVSVVGFLLAGFVLVALQAVQLVLGDGQAATTISEELGPRTFAVATVSGLFAFALEYLRPGGGCEA